MGTLTFSSLARISDYRSRGPSPVYHGQARSTPLPAISPQIPTGPVDARTEQALQWSGLKIDRAKGGSAQSALFAGLYTFSAGSQAPSSAGPDLELGYSFSSIKKILAYSDSLRARTPEAGSSSDTSKVDPAAQETLDTLSRFL